MKSAIFQLTNNDWQRHGEYNNCECNQAQLVLCFGSKALLAEPGTYQLLKKKFPVADIAICSTAGEIYHNIVQDNSLVAAGLHFNNTIIRHAQVNIASYTNSYEAGLALIKMLPTEGLRYVLVLSDGSRVNGGDLVKGLNEAAGNRVPVTGGLAGDGTDFTSTLVGLNAAPTEGTIIALGFYGDKLVVTHGSNGGWQTFGLEKEVTRSSGNKLYEVDGQLALDMYKKYLGPAEAAQLPGSALLFPLSVIIPGSTQPVVRTILSIDHEESSMTFAGDIPEGSKVRFMKANFDMLTDAAAVAAQSAMLNNTEQPDFSLLVSCVGRKIILGARTEDEVDAVLESLGDRTPVTGFYSYGEISPFNEGGECQLHNQTMTITSFYELP